MAKGEARFISMTVAVFQTDSRPFAPPHTASASAELTRLSKSTMTPFILPNRFADLSPTIPSSRETLLILVTAFLLLTCWHFRYLNWNVAFVHPAKERLVRIRMLSSHSFSATMDLGPWGKGNLQTTRHILLPTADVEKKLVAAESSSQMQRHGNPIVAYHTASVSSRANEDRIAINNIPGEVLATLHHDVATSFWTRWARLVTSASKEGANGANDWSLFSVIDGHTGSQICNLLERVLHPVLVNALSVPDGSRSMRKGVSDELSNACVSQTSSSPPQPEAADMISITDLDNDIQRTSTALLNDEINASTAITSLPLPSPALTQLATLDRGGAVFSTLLVNSSENKLYAINLGDSRLVAGWWNPKTRMWRCDVITEVGDMNCDNPLEAAR